MALSFWPIGERVTQKFKLVKTTASNMANMSTTTTMSNTTITDVMIMAMATMTTHLILNRP